jgi:hypothetical protein
MASSCHGADGAGMMNRLSEEGKLIQSLELDRSGTRHFQVPDLPSWGDNALGLVKFRITYIELKRLYIDYPWSF